ncbi:MAG: PAAR domain-containing protein [Bacteroidetes bacterium]|nr:PAAR domain-containing protein [Bacteroidota bacterium]
MNEAARISDNHVCTKTNPDGSPHVGGLITAGIMSVIIGGQPAATEGSICTCVGEPDSIKGGSSSVLFQGQKAARLGDMTNHNGFIQTGFMTVIIGG